MSKLVITSPDEGDSGEQQYCSLSHSAPNHRYSLGHAPNNPTPDHHDPHHHDHNPNNHYHHATNNHHPHHHTNHRQHHPLCLSVYKSTHDNSGNDNDSTDFNHTDNHANNHIDNHPDNNTNNHTDNHTNNHSFHNSNKCSNHDDGDDANIYNNCRLNDFRWSLH
nr:hypothetical protein BaRGS_020952 [Batillaria attramentaria]